MAVIGLSKPLSDTVGYLEWSANAPAGVYQAVGYPVEHNGRLVSDAGYMAIGAHDIFDISKIYNAPGSSGGPILDGRNRVVGVISSYNWAAGSIGKATALPPGSGTTTPSSKRAERSSPARRRSISGATSPSTRMSSPPMAPT